MDFVVCNAKSEPKLVIELDDFTHDTPSRMARDEFVDTVLESCGYGVVHTRNIDRDELYPVLRRLQKNGSLTTYDRPYQGRNRRYYRITVSGRALLEQYRKEWLNYKQQVDFFLDEK